MHYSGLSVCRLKVNGLGTYLLSHYLHRVDQLLFTILEVAADWHELVIP